MEHLLTTCLPMCPNSEQTIKKGRVTRNLGLSGGTESETAKVPFIVNPNLVLGILRGLPIRGRRV